LEKVGGEEYNISFENKITVKNEEGVDESVKIIF